MARRADLLDRLEQRVMRDPMARARGHLLALDDRKVLERVADGRDVDRRERAERLLVLHDVAGGYRPPVDAGPAVSALWHPHERRARRRAAARGVALRAGGAALGVGVGLGAVAGGALLAALFSPRARAWLRGLFFAG